MKAFKALGMNLAFSDAADFSGMISNQNNHICKIIHKAVIEVDEAGTKAAAATAVIADKNSVGFPVDGFIEFRADHPFEYVLYHKASGAALFAGQYWGK